MVATEARTVWKRAVRTLLECFLAQEEHTKGLLPSSVKFVIQSVESVIQSMVENSLIVGRRGKCM